jgi:hypothetical protein
MPWGVLGVAALLIFFAVLVGICRIFVPWRLAIRMALLMLAIGLGVVTSGGVMNTVANKSALKTLSEAELIGAGGAMILTGVFFVRWVRRRTRRSTDVSD